MRTWAVFILLILLFIPVSHTVIAGDPSEEYTLRRLFLEIEDGDTVVYRGRRMRFLGVDTPEVKNPELGFWINQPYGLEAKEYTRRQIKQAKRVTFIGGGIDRYDRNRTR